MSEFEGLNWCLCGRHGYDEMEKKQIEMNRHCSGAVAELSVFVCITGCTYLFFNEIYLLRYGDSRLNLMF